MRSLLLSLILLPSLALAAPGPLQAGASRIDVTPREWPVIQNGGFLEATLTLASDPIHARGLYLANGETEMALVIVDSCMMPLDVCDEAKALATARCGIPKDRILIAATHTHSAPSVMDYCLGSRADPKYRQFLPMKIAEAIVQAKASKQPAQAGWGMIDVPELTKNRRWITRRDKPLTDPFGEKSVFANMHPGYLNPDFVGPSGPTDPELSLLSVQTADGQPLAVLANYSMHYFGGHAGVSADYFGRFCELLAERLAPGREAFVGIMSQGTSGDLWWGDYSRPERKDMTIEKYSSAMVDKALEAHRGIRHQREVELAMAERRMTLNRRMPDEKRLAWAREKVAAMGNRRPSNQPEVYAEQALYFERNPTDDLVLQALRIGDLGIAALPNEVFALTGLKLKAQSPLPMSFNIELANAACGYIPPPEQHALGGYTTWPARTAALEVEAEPKIVEAVLGLLEKVSGQKRRQYEEPETPYSRAVKESKPWAYYRMGDQGGWRPYKEGGGGISFKSAVDTKESAMAGIELKCAFHLPGVDKAGFGEPGTSRSIQLAGGFMMVRHMSRPNNHDYTVSFWIWNGIPNDALLDTGVLYARRGDVLSIGGTRTSPGVLSIGSLKGRTSMTSREWHHVVLLRKGNHIAVHLDGAVEPDLAGEYEYSEGDPIAPNLFYEWLGRSWDMANNFQGRIDEVALYDRALTTQELAEIYQKAGLKTAAITPPPPMSPEASMAATHVRQGYRLELVAAEPQVQDPVALDWGADGRLWVAEMADYPQGMDGKGKPGGRVRWLRDNDGDGRYEESVVFLDGLSFPNGVMAWRKGALVTAAPEIIYAEDRDGDGKADFRQTLFSGFLAQNQQLRVNGLRWGLDNWIYCASGGHHSGFGADNKIHAVLLNQQVLVGSRDFRFKPDTGVIDPQSGPSQFGRCRDNWGNWYGVQNSYPIWHYVLADHYLRRNLAVAAPDPRVQLRPPANPQVFPAKAPDKRYHSFEQGGRYTSGCGQSVYLDSLLFPDEPGKQHAFTCEPFHNVAQHHVLTDDGVSFKGERGDDGPLDFFASADPWCKPVMTRTGPDGALYVVDMYRYIVEHPDFLPANGRAELGAYWRYGEDRGRIYRILPEAAQARPVPKLAAMSATELIGQLASPNGMVRDIAHRLLVERQDSSAVSGLLAMAAKHESPYARLHAWCALEGLEALSQEHVLAAVRDPHPMIRREAIRITESVLTDVTKEHFGHLVEDSSAKVRLQLALSLGAWRGPAAGEMLAALAARSDLDTFTRAAILSSAGSHYGKLLGSLVRGDASEELIGPLLGMGIVDRRDALAKVLAEAFAPIDGKFSARQFGLFATLLDALRQRQVDWDKARSVADSFGQAMSQAAAMFDAARAQAAAGGDDASLTQALRLLGRQPEHAASDISRAAKILVPQTPKPVQHAALAVLARIGSEAAIGQMLDQWASAEPDLRAVILEQTLPHANRAQWLLGKVKAKSIAVDDLDAATRERLRQHRDATVVALAKDVLGATDTSDRAEIVRSFQPALGLSGQAEAGKEIFSQRCAVCHQLGDLGRAIGPDLRSLTSKDKASLLGAIIHPNENVDPRHVAYTAQLTNGEAAYGIIVGETGNSLMLLQIHGEKKTIARSNLAKLESSKRSLMPEGLETGLTHQQMADLLEWLAGALRVEGSR